MNDIRQPKGPSSAEMQIAMGGGDNNSSAPSSRQSPENIGAGDGNSKFMPQPLAGGPGVIDTALQGADINNLTSSGSIDDTLRIQAPDFLSVFDGPFMQPFGISNPEGFDIKGLGEVDLSKAAGVPTGLNLGAPATGIMGNKGGGRE